MDAKVLESISKQSRFIEIIRSIARKGDWAHLLTRRVCEETPVFVARVVEFDEMTMDFDLSKFFDDIRTLLTTDMLDEPALFRDNLDGADMHTLGAALLALYPFKFRCGSKLHEWEKDGAKLMRGIVKEAITDVPQNKMCMAHGLLAVMNNVNFFNWKLVARSLHTLPEGIRDVEYAALLKSVDRSFPYEYHQDRRKQVLFEIKSNLYTVK